MARGTGSARVRAHQAVFSINVYEFIFPCINLEILELPGVDEATFRSPFEGLARVREGSKLHKCLTEIKSVS